MVITRRMASLLFSTGSCLQKKRNDIYETVSTGPVLI